MLKENYIKYVKYEIISMSLNTFIWMALATFSIVSIGLLGTASITIFELLIFVFSLLGTHIAFKSSGSFRMFTIFEIILETIFLLSILYLIYIDSEYLAVAIYLVAIVGKLVRPAIAEKGRKFEDKELKKQSNKRLLSLIRKRDGYLCDIFGILGGLTAVVFLSIVEVDLNTFAALMLFLNVIQNMFDYAKWIKYLK